MNTSPSRPLILLSNDDGFDAPGARILAQWLSRYGDVVSVCPDGPRSAQSMAITVNAALRITPVELTDRIKRYKINGTPTDCIKLAMHTVMPRRPDLVVSGINHGSNASINVMYSGTMGAASEGAAFGIPSIGFSLTDHSTNADFEGCRRFVDHLVPLILREGLPEGVALNVNIPDCRPYPEEIRVVRSAKGRWSDEYEEYIDPQGGKFYWLKGTFTNEEPEAEDTDQWCLDHGIATIVPTMLDRTCPDLSPFARLALRNPAR